jgi:hypothetical protein
MRYETVSGVFFSLISLAQLMRTIMRWPAQVDGLTIPVWFSGIAFIVTAALAVWAFRSAGNQARV